jgi:hypothetical protein
MIEPHPRRNWFTNLLSNGWITTGILVIGIVFSAGAWANKSTADEDKTAIATAENTRRIVALETKDGVRGDAIARIDTRTARMETAIELMIGRKEYRPLSDPQ